MANLDPAGHWRRSRLLAIAALTVWGVVALALPFFAFVANGAVLGGVVGYAFVAEGTLFMTVVLVFWFARRQRTIDREYAMAEED